MSPFHRSLLLGSTLASAITTSGFSATILVTDTFETSLGSWTGSADATLYSYSSGTNYATTGTGAARLNTGGWNGANPLTLTTPLTLNSLGATSVTVAFDFKWDGGNATRFFNVQYSTNGGANWSDWGSRTNAPSTASLSRTLNSGLTDQFLIRFLPKGDGGNGPYAYLDNVVISAEGVTLPPPASAIPEPGAALAGIFALLALGHRRR